MRRGNWCGDYNVLYAGIHIRQFDSRYSGNCKEVALYQVWAASLSANDGIRTHISVYAALYSWPASEA